MDPKLDAAALWQTLLEMAIDDALDEILAMTAEERDTYIRENGGDPRCVARTLR
jgi:ribulose bisphosphate carboxylase small subunit